MKKINKLQYSLQKTTLNNGKNMENMKTTRKHVEKMNKLQYFLQKIYIKLRKMWKNTKTTWKTMKKNSKNYQVGTTTKNWEKKSWDEKLVKQTTNNYRIN